MNLQISWPGKHEERKKKKDIQKEISRKRAIISVDYS